MDLSAQEVNLFVPHTDVVRIVQPPTTATQSEPDMDLWIIAAIVMLVGWGAMTLLTEAPGWIHLLLTAGVFILIWRMVVRNTPSGPRGKN